MANDNLTLDQVVAEAKSAEITKQQDQILQSNPTAADLSEIKDIMTKEFRTTDVDATNSKMAKMAKMTIGLNATSKTLLQMWSSAKPPS